MYTEKNLYELLCTTVTHKTAMYNSHSQNGYVQKIYSVILIYQFSNALYDSNRVFTYLAQKTIKIVLISALISLKIWNLFRVKNCT